MTRQVRPNGMVFAVDTVFARGNRTARVYRSTPDGCEVIWDEFVDPRTNERHGAISSFLSAEEIGQDVSRGKIRLIKLPESVAPRGLPSGAIRATPAESERIRNRECYVEAAQELIDQGLMRPRKAEFVRYYAQIFASGMRKADERSRSASKVKKCGTRLTILRPPTCGETIFRWWSAWIDAGRVVNKDKLANCGARPGRRYSDEENAFFSQVIKMRLTEERPSVSSILESVRSAVRCENERRLAQPIPLTQLTIPGYDWIHNLISQLAPVDHRVRTRGMDVAYRDLHTLGLGLQITRPLERVEIDEYTVDLVVFMDMLNLKELLTEEEAIGLGLDGQPRRLILSAAVDVCTKAILGLQIAPDTSAEVTLRTIEMIYLDKQPLADASGAEMPWPMRGHPLELALDRASVNMSDTIYQRLSAAGITNMAVPAGKPFLKPSIERFFATVGSLFLQRFTGRTFSDVVRKGENDPAARATVTLEDFLYWLTRWIVDVYHTRKPDVLGRKSPLEEWTDACERTPPPVRTDERMLRQAFGAEFPRKLARDGITLNGLKYQHEELANWFLGSAQHQVRVLTWDKNIGEIDVILPDGRIITAECVDPTWANKSRADLVRAVNAGKRTEAFGQGTRDRSIVAMDRFTAQKAALRNLVPTDMNPAELDANRQEFTRYMNSADRQIEAYDDLFDGEVQKTPSQTAQDGAEHAAPPSGSSRPRDTGEIME